MDNTVYKIIELVGSSNSGIEDAVQTAITQASKSIKNLKWFTIQEVRGSITDDKVECYQVVMKAGFKIEDTASYENQAEAAISQKSVSELSSNYNETKELPHDVKLDIGHKTNMQEKQVDFIAEGGNSQPLHKEI